MKKTKLLIFSVFAFITLVAVIAGLFWLSLDKTTRCSFIYGKNICSFYAVMDMSDAVNDMANADFDKMMNLCKAMTNVPKKDSCFELVAQTFARINMNKAEEACNEIKGFDRVNSKEDCYKRIYWQIEIEKVIKRHETELMVIPGVVGVGIGESEGRLVINILVEKFTPELKNKLPSKLEGFEVQAEVVGEIIPFAGKCGIENCHGLEITCGPNIAEICTQEYAFGDRCREYARCEIINGKCQLVKSEKFERCKFCVAKCSQDFKDDIVKSFDCESKCAE